jgi:antitoxin component of RelBE/YafQ-DinJ toxin-antitoxin module
MDAIVTARVPLEIKEQGSAALKKIDATQTLLVNAAYEYLLKTGKLPTVAENTNKAQRTLTDKQQQELKRLLAATSLPLSPKWSTMSAKDIKAIRLEERHGRAV